MNLYSKVDLMIVPVDGHPIAVFASRQGRDLLACCTFAVLENECCQVLQRVQTELVHHLHEAPATRVVTNGKRMEVPNDLVLLAHVAAQDCNEILVQLSAPKQLHRRQADPLLVHLFCVRAEATSANIDNVCRGSEKADQPRRYSGVVRLCAFAKHGCDCCDVVQMSRTQPRIVCHEDVARKELLRTKALNEMANGLGH